MRAIQFMISVSQPIIAATNRLVIYPPFLGGYLLSNFIQPVYRLSKTPVSDETPFAGGSPAITASQAYRQLSQPYRLFASDLLLRLLRRNLSLVSSDRQLRSFRAGFLSRDLEDAKQSSSVLRGESRPLLHSLGFRHLPSNSLLLRLSSQVLRILKATLHPLVHLGDGPTFSLQVRLGILLARGVILLPGRGVGSRTICLPMNDSLLLLLLCLGDNHTPSHLTSLPQIRPDAHFARGGDSLPHQQMPRLPVEFHPMMSANPLRFSYFRTKGRVT